MKLWDFALSAWARPDVRRICLELQDQHGQCVTLLLWRAWTAIEGRQVSETLTGDAIALAKWWDGGVIKPLRAGRRVLDQNITSAKEGGRGELRVAVQAAELAAERELADELNALTDGPSATLERTRGVALAEVAESWNGSDARSAAFSLADALG